MRKIQMVDLLGQYEHIKEELDQALINVVRSSQYINGPEVHAFQEELEKYLGVKHVIPCANGTDALQVAMMALDLQPGDEVITSNFTYVATAEVIALLRLTPVLVDALPDTFNLDPEAVRRAITPKTKAIVPVHLFGQSADMDSIMAIAKEHDLYVIEDTAQAIGSDYKGDAHSGKAGTFGEFGCTSFFPSKNLGCYGDGGALFTNNDELALKARQTANHGQTKRYYHDRIGVNSRLDSLQAAILRIKLRKLDEYNDARRAAADRYDNAFKGHDLFKTPFRDPKSSHVFHQYTLKTKGFDRFEMQNFLSEKGVPAMIYYPVPLHLQSAYRDPRYTKGDFPVTEDLCERVISLPMHSELDEEQQDYIIDSVLEFANKTLQV